MPSKGNHNRTSETQTQRSNSSRQNSEKSILKEKDFEPSENLDILEYLQEHKNKLIDRYGCEKSKNRRCPHYYFINGNKSILIILQGDITRTRVDAIVNAANEHMTGGGGVDGIIHQAAGRQLYEACRAHKQISGGMRLPTGHSRILLSYNMSSTTYYIINTAGPVYNQYRAQECEEELRSCYKTALGLAKLYDLETIGFTAISCGIFGYPSNDGATAALETVNKEAGTVPVVVFVLWDDHIYDAWVKQARELNFLEFDIENPAIPQSPAPSNISGPPKSPTTSGTNDDQPKSPSTYNPPVRDLSTPNKTTVASDESIEAVIERLPSVPDDTPNTQPMDESDNDPTNTNVLLHPQNTLEMAGDSQCESNPLPHCDSEQRSVEEIDDKEKVNNDT